MPVKEKTKETKKTPLSVKMAAIFLVPLTIVMLFEAAARFVYAYREDIQNFPLVSGMVQRGVSLDPYEMPAPGKGGHWILRPGYQATVAELAADKKRAGHDFGARLLQTEIDRRALKGKGVLRINADGFKGAELDRSHAGPRILALGDSVTFGIGTRDYPRVLGETLNGRGLAVEVVNGGVEGYSARNVIYEMERYKFLKPEIVTLYIGWNDLYSDVSWRDDWENMLRLVWLYKQAAKAFEAILGDKRGKAEELFNRALKPGPDSPDVKKLKHYIPPFIKKIERIADEFLAIGSKVVLVTLPGLFTMRADPSPKALKIGHLPYFTDNPFVLAKLTERYNKALRGLAARRTLELIDLDEWSGQALRPREAFFIDSIHLNSRGLEMVGVHMADRLAKLIRDKK